MHWTRCNFDLVTLKRLKSHLWYEKTIATLHWLLIDASDIGSGGYLENVAGKRFSGIYQLNIESSVVNLVNDNQNAVRILLIGSRVPELHEKAFEIAILHRVVK